MHLVECLCPCVWTAPILSNKPACVSYCCVLECFLQQVSKPTPWAGRAEVPISPWGDLLGHRLLMARRQGGTEDIIPVIQCEASAGFLDFPPNPTARHPHILPSEAPQLFSIQTAADCMYFITQSVAKHALQIPANVRISVLLMVISERSQK